MASDRLRLFYLQAFLVYYWQVIAIANNIFPNNMIHIIVSVWN